jgi:hypothetical protein
MDNNPSLLTIERYAPHRKAIWDAFVGLAKNATFLFYRDYMDYHSDRFEDHSLMVFRRDELVGILPANFAEDGTLISHAGLTYGGLAVSPAATLGDVLSYFQAVLLDLNTRRIDRLLYKRIPSFYNTQPDDDLGYAMFLLDATLYRRDCALVVPTCHRLPFQKRRIRQIQKAERMDVRIVRDPGFAPFWDQVLTPRLTDRHGVKPVHTLEEITLLASRFPDCIKQYSAYVGDHIVAGTTIYETPTVAHAQYIAATDEGLKIGALDLLFKWLLDEGYPQKRYFDLGICNEPQGRMLNRGLLDWKEGFGGRSYAHDFYEVASSSYTKLESVFKSPPDSASKS